MVDIGTDINSEWGFNDNGDLILSSDEDNLVQAIINRLSCNQPSLEIYYGFYGGFLSSYLGRKRTQESLDFLKIELDTILGQEPRINEFNSNCYYDDNGRVRIDLELSVNDSIVDLNLVLDNGGVSIGD